MDIAAVAMLINDRKTGEDVVRRAATMLRALYDNHATIEPEGIACPFRWGALATEGMATFSRLLHYSCAALAARDAAKHATADIARARQRAGQALRHYRSAQPWLHDEGLRPAEATEKFGATLVTLVDALTVSAVVAVPRKVALLQLLAEQTTLKSVAKVARSQLALVLLDHWTTARTDPRHGAPPAPADSDDTDVDKHAASVAAAILNSQLVAPHDVTDAQKRFIAVNVAAYGQEAVDIGEVTKILVAPPSLRAEFSVTSTMPALSTTIELPTLPCPFPQE